MLISVALVLGVAKLIQLIKEVLPWPVEAWVKSLLTFVLAGLGALVVAEDPSGVVPDRWGRLGTRWSRTRRLEGSAARW